PTRKRKTLQVNGTFCFDIGLHPPKKWSLHQTQGDSVISGREFAEFGTVRPRFESRAPDHFDPTSHRPKRSYDSKAQPAAIETSTKRPGFLQHPCWRRRRGACLESPTARGSTPPDV